MLDSSDFELFNVSLDVFGISINDIQIRYKCNLWEKVFELDFAPYVNEF